MSNYRANTRFADEEVLSPAERWSVLQASAVVGFSSWACGGSYAWGPPAILALAVLAIPIVAMRGREVPQLRWRPFLPAMLWMLFCGAAWLNPSYRQIASGSWLPESFVSWLPSAVDRQRALSAGLPWLAALIEGGALIAIMPSRRAIVWLWRFVGLNGFILAAAGAWFRFANAEQMLGFIDPPEPSYFFATFFYKNHWAAFGALAGAACLALVQVDWAAALRRSPDAKGRVLLFGGAGLLTLVTLPLAGSRAGALLAIALIAGIVGTLIAALRRSPAAPRGFVVPATFAVMGIGVLGFAIDAYRPRAEFDLARTQQELTQAADTMPNLRVSLSRDTWRMARARPWFGWGPGSFAIVFPLYQGNYLRTPDGRSQARIEDAHNDWLQLLAECGVVGSAMIILPFGVCLARAWKSGSPPGRWIAAACSLIALYALIDFPFRNPAVLMACTVLVTTAGSGTDRHRGPTV